MNGISNTSDMYLASFVFLMTPVRVCFDANLQRVPAKSKTRKILGVVIDDCLSWKNRMTVFQKQFLKILVS